MYLSASTRLAQDTRHYLLENYKGGSLLFISSITAFEAPPAPLLYPAKVTLNNYAKIFRERR